jgi:hypothetical protein
MKILLLRNLHIARNFHLHLLETSSQKNDEKDSKITLNFYPKKKLFTLLVEGKKCIKRRENSPQAKFSLCLGKFLVKVFLAAQEKSFH